ncbi:hypothetical protein BN946_scf185015.g116 [Trametes cinnabarina]|uniref:Uncharacterized protein n=1 Tax=Pycnoporus cinnabarinus TaxID=5643 RepID=A0A060SH43_PYCCI|nr:hypothetical protein BN946_scf185015.g116 [Trametes cinnabarina]
MVPLIPALALAFVSFISSAFVILRIVIPILPPHPLSRRVAPSEFGLPNYRTVSPADKSHLWLAACDLLALGIFTWQVVNEFLGGPADYAIAHDPASAVRLWFALTLRQTCLFVVSALTLLHVRMGRPVSFGGKHWMLWGPTLVLVVTSTALAGVFAATSVTSLFVGLVAYSTTIAVFSSVAFGCLVGTLVIIKRNLAALNDIRDPWPPAKMLEEEKPRPSFATEDIDALKDGSSWITSRASSRCESVSAWSFNTHHSRAASNASARMLPNPATASYPSLAPKSSFWFNPATPFSSHESVPPVPPLPAPYRPVSTTSAHINSDPDPFKRQAPRMGSQSSWLTEPSVYQPTLSNWSFPTTHPPSPPPSAATLPGLGTDMLPSTAVSRPLTPAMASTEVLGGYGYVAENNSAEKGFNSFSSQSSGDLDMTAYRTAGWFLMIWVPLGLSLPYMFMVSPGFVSSPAASILLLLSVTLSSPLLAINILFRSPIPIPSSLFETYSEPPSAVLRAPSPQSTAPSYGFSHEYKRSGSVTVVEGRRSTDVWLTNGDAVDGRGKIGRALGLLQPKPKLAVLPPEGEEMQEEPLTPPLPMQMMERSLPPTPAQSELSAELGRTRPRKESKASSYYSGTSDSVAFQTQIMIAQRHYSALATTMVVPRSPTADRRASSMDESAVGIAVSGVETPQAQKTRHSQHLRVRSVSSITGSHNGADPRFPVSPPPASPLPPTPPSVRERKARLLSHRKSQSQSSSSVGFSFGAVGADDIAEIDALSAKVLPLLVPGLTVGADVRIRDDWGLPSPHDRHRRQTGTMKSSRTVPVEMGGLSSGFSTDFSSPDMHSTPAEDHKTQPRQKKTSMHRRHHFSLPSLSLGKDGMHSLSAWRNELNRALENKLGNATSSPSDNSQRRNTIYGYGGELVPNSTSHLNVVTEDDELLRPASPAAHPEQRRPVSAQTFGPDALALPARSQDGRASSRNSLATLITALDQELRMPLPPPSATSEVTLFDIENFEAEGPLASSTPHESQRTQPKSKSRVPPVPKIRDGPTATRRSSIKYIVSDENAAPESPRIEVPQKGQSLAQWGARAIRGLRPLSLLQERNLNQGVVDTRPLTLGKKSKGTDENADPDAVLHSKGKAALKPLRLSRNETTKERALLRKQEVLPDVVVRPPSGIENGHYGYGYA